MINSWRRNENCDEKQRLFARNMHITHGLIHEDTRHRIFRPNTGRWVGYIWARRVQIGIYPGLYFLRQCKGQRGSGTPSKSLIAIG